MKIIIIIPGFNVGPALGKTVENIDSVFLEKAEQVLVMDNCSTDETGDIINRLKTTERFREKLKVRRNSDDFSTGGSLKIALAYAIRKGFTHAIVLSPFHGTSTDQVLADLFKHNHSEPGLDFILCSRFDSEGKPPLAFVNSMMGGILNVMTRLLCKVSVSDAEGHSFWLRLSVLRDVPFELLSNEPYFNLQLNVLLSASKSVRSSVIPMDSGDKVTSALRGRLGYFFGALGSLLKYRVNRLIGKAGFGQLVKENWLQVLSKELANISPGG